MKKDHPLLGLLVVVLVFIGAISLAYFRYLGSGFSNKNTVAYENKESEANTTVNPTSKVYTDTEHGFELSYPASQFTKLDYIKSDKEDASDYLRIQNYRMDKGTGEGLAQDEYYFEMYIIAANEPCRESVVTSGAAVNLGNGAGYKGGLPGSEISKERSSAMCLFKNGKQFYTVITEGNKEASIANSIFNSIKFVSS